MCKCGSVCSVNSLGSCILNLMIFQRASSALVTQDQSPARSTFSATSGVAAYDEVVLKDMSSAEVTHAHRSDVNDHNTSPSEKILSSLSSKNTLSPPVMRQIDAIQTRRNLETIVQVRLTKN